MAVEVKGSYGCQGKRGLYGCQGKGIIRLSG